MTYIHESKRTNESEPRSFRITFHLGTDSEGKPITRTSIWVAPSELSEEELLMNIQQTAEAYEKVIKSFVI